VNSLVMIGVIDGSGSYCMLDLFVFSAVGAYVTDKPCLKILVMMRCSA
jgi:hypothetical protein